jgi:hypothetical protein
MTGLWLIAVFIVTQNSSLGNAKYEARIRGARFEFCLIGVLGDLKVGTWVVYGLPLKIR